MDYICKVFKVRPIQLDDAPACLEIYRPYVEGTVISFEYEAPSLSEWETRIKVITSEYPWLVCEREGEVIGYAYGCRHRYRTAYSWSVESAIYLSENFHGRGVARELYKTLFELLRLQGYVNVYAGVTAPNSRSEAFHLSMGFYEVGAFRNIGFKHGKWHDTRWFQLHLCEHPVTPVTLKTMNEINNMPEFRKILEIANGRLKGRQP
jgi:L-amino acid N-acyltransferase YncA